MNQPKDEAFKTVTCEKLVIRKPYQQSRVEIDIDTVGAHVAVLNGANKIVAEIYIEIDELGRGGGRVAVYNSDGSLRDEM